MKINRLIGGLAAAALGTLVLGTAQTASAEATRYEIIGGGIPKSLTGKPGDAKAGRKIAYGRKAGNCLACHKMPIPEQQFHGEIGPDLAGSGSRFTASEMRLRIVNPKVINPATFMPAFYRNTGLHRVQKKWKGKTILKAQQVEDLVAYLMTLK